jgi:hypothetical protein
MSKFIKLTCLIINTSHIRSIILKNNKYCIQLINPVEELEICENKNITDYKAVKEWIRCLDFTNF